MPLPSAVVRRREEIQNRLAQEEAARTANLNGEPPAPPANGEPPVTPTIPTAPLRTELATVKQDAQNGGDIAKVLERMEQMQARFDSEHGRLVTMQAQIETQAQQLAVAEQNRVFLEGKLQEQAEELRAAKAGAIRNKANDALSILDGPELTQEELDSFNPENLKVVAGLSQAQLKKLKPVFDAYETRLAEMEEKINAATGVASRFEQVETTVRATTEQEARRTERQFYIDAFKDTPHQDFEVFTKTPEWIALMKKDVPGMSGVKYSQLVSSYQRSRNTVGLIGVFDIFKHENKQKTSLADLATPSATTASQLPSPTQTKPTFKSSDYRTKLNEFNKKRMTPEDWQKFKTEFLEAQKDNRVLPG